ncbi:lipase family protein [Kribbella catacumbae]|uniref:lipase family protein n=1 Tax=Kribbella catacumbae TaxID=460086 RepID=UPI000366382F|nr:lipase family protein [Kribbella catacumbae]
MNGRRKALVALAVSIGLLATAAPPASAAIAEPDQDVFYQPAPGYESKTPGTVLKKRAVTVTGLGIPLPVKAIQLQSRSTDAKNRPVTVVSTVIVPLTPYLGQRPLLSYQPAIDSLGDQCNPSYTLRTGLEKELPLLALGLAKGWVVVVTDYQGPRDAYGAGHMEGHAVLDGIRATLATSETGLSAQTKVGIWGYSGGGLATGWAAQLQPAYAPELNLVGVASGGMPADLAAAGRQMDGGPFAGLFIAAAIGVSREYPELLSIFNAKGKQLIAAMDDLCVTEEALYAFHSVKQYSDSPDPLGEPIAQQVLTINKMGSSGPKAPVYLYHSKFDELIPWSAGKAVNDAWCAKGTKVLMYTDYASEHNVLAVTGAPAAVAYLNARFLGFKAPSTC